ncbi:hypothetical protein CW731_09485 [Polaribacter sp. ALD11]|uniref:O-antigen ligase family protein n=1 Tax=Polaribacter sp. ALD11 TaxID=2058137 RepID=UPI000C316A05|nr:O-antigen ligase family protein [Polaribacter sp. ALD11]AUC85507.1 hypothetical protein CW731_09485 [Polaribacter sp. ALD11]
MKTISLKNIWTLVLSLIAAFPLLPKVVESILMIVFFILSIILYFKRDKGILKHNNNLKDILLLSSLFVIYLLSSLYSDNYVESLRFIILAAPILMFPLCLGFFYDTEISSKQFRRIKIVYITSLFLSLLITHFHLSYTVTDTISNWNYRNLFEDYTRVHGTYYSLWIGFGILILINEIFKKKRSNRIFYYLPFLVLIGYFFYWQITIAARLPLFITSILGMLYIVKQLKKTHRLLIISLFGFACVFYIFLKFDSIKSKIKFDLPEGKYALQHKDMTSEEIRTGIYYCSTSLIKNSLLFGYGVGDVNDQLNICYKQKIKSDVYQLFHYNSHNQYFQVFLAAGLFGILFFFFNIFNIFNISIRNKDELFIMFNLLLFTGFLTENILSRHDGVIFYSYFVNLFYFQKRKR